MPDVFISYSRKDSEFVHHLFDALTAAERNAWVDWEDIPVTAEWWIEIERGIEAADSFLFVISPDSVASQVCNQEIEHAVTHNKRLIPIVRRDAMHEQVNQALARHNWLYCREKDDFNQAFGQLIDALNTDLDYVRAHTRLLVRAREWEEKGRDASYLLRGSDLHAAESWLAESGGKEPKPTELQTNYILASRRASSNRQRALLAGVSAALGLTAILALVALALYGLADSSRRESEQRGTAVAQQAATATNALGLSQVRGTEVAQQAATAVAAQATSERSSAEWKSLAWAVDSAQALSAGNGDLALALALQANTISNPPAQAQAALVAAAYAPGTGMVYSGQHTSWIDAEGVSPDGQWLLSGGYDGKLVSWNAETGAAVHTTDFGSEQRTVEGVQLALGSVTGIAFESDSVALLGHSDGVLRLWDVSAWKEIASVQTSAYVNALALSPDGGIAAVGSTGASNNLALWDAHRLTRLRTLNGHGGDVTSLAFSADGKQLLSGSNDATMRLWDVATGDLIRTFGPIRDPNEPNLIVRGVVFGPPMADGTPTAISATNSGQISAWNLNTGEEIRPYDVGSTPAGVAAVALNPDRGILAVAGLDDMLYLWDTASGQLIRRFIGHSAGLMSVVFSADGRLVFSAAEDQTLRRWYTSSAAQLRTLRDASATGGFASLTINADGTRALTGGRTQNPVVTLWDLKTGTVIRRMQGHTDSVTALAFNPDGTTAISGAFDGTLRVWNLDTGEAIQVFNLGVQAIPSAVYSADGRSALITTITNGFLADGWAALIDLDTGKELKRFDSDTGLATAAIFSPDHAQILVGSATPNAQGEITLWDAQSGDLIRTFDSGHTAAISTLQFSADGSKVLSAAQDFTSILWDAASGHEIRRFVGHTDIVSSAHFSPDERTVITGSFDRTIRLWDASSGSEILSLDAHADGVRAVVFAPDGQTAYSATRDGSLTQWLVASDAATLSAWLPAHRYVRDLTCAERAQYRVEPLCKP